MTGYFFLYIPGGYVIFSTSKNFQASIYTSDMVGKPGDKKVIAPQITSGLSPLRQALLVYQKKFFLNNLFCFWVHILYSYIDHVFFLAQNV